MWPLGGLSVSIWDSPQRDIETLRHFDTYGSQGLLRGGGVAYFGLSGTANVKEWGDVIWRDYGPFYFMCFLCVFGTVWFSLI